MLENWLPQLHRPKNEVLTLIMAGVALVPLLIPVLTSADWSTVDGVMSVIIAVATIVARRFSVGMETHAEMAADSAEPVA